MLAVEFYTLLAVTSVGGVVPKYADLAAHMNVPASAVHTAVKRLIDARLMTSGTEGRPRILVEQTIEFICFGASYVFPAKIGPVSLGLPTGAHASPMSEVLNVSEDMKLVWASPAGSFRGESISPIHHKLPDLALQDESIYRLGVIVDSIRVGGAREKNIARDLVKSEIPNLMAKRHE